MIDLRTNLTRHGGWVLGLILLSCTNPPSSSTSSNSAYPPITDDEILFLVGKDTVSVEEFTYVFEKNAINREDSELKQELDEYLELYVNFKLKVLEAESLGYPERPTFQSEFGQYRDQLAQSYMTDHDASDRLIEEAYERLKEEVNAAHLLIQLPETATPADTLAAYEKIMEYRRQVLDGESDFETVAKAHSEDPSVERNGGNLGYFSALQMVYPFENAAFNTPVGEVSMPIRTRFGYHILDVRDRRPSAGKIQVSHIMVRATDGMPEEQMKSAEEKAKDIYSRLQNGENWFELCRQFSDDVRTKSRGGLLPMFGSGEMVVEFERAAFTLSDVGDFTAPVQTAYGWHIIKLEDRQGLKPFDEMEGELKNRISRDSRSEITQKAFMERLKRENQLEIVQEVLDQVLAQADSSLLIGQWQRPRDTELQKETVISLGGGETTYIVDDFFQYVSSKQGRSNYQDPGQYMYLLFDRYSEDVLLEFEKAHLADKYEDYRYLVKEYRDGILLFQLMDETIWSKAVSDTTGLREFFEANRSDYRWEERATSVILNAANEQVAQEAKGYLDQGAYPTAVQDKDVSFAGPIRMEVSDNQRLVLNEAITLLVNDPTAKLDLLVKVVGTDSSGYQTILKYFEERGIEADHLESTFVTEADAKGLVLSVWSQRSKAMEGYFNQQGALTLVVKEGLYERTDEPVLEEITWKEGRYDLQWDNRTYHVWVKDIQEGAEKQLGEVRGAVISDYQDHLEKEWIAELRKKYPVRINEQARKAVYQSYDLD